MSKKKHRSRISKKSAKSSPKTRQPAPTKPETISADESQVKESLWRRIVFFKPRLPIYIFIILFIFKFTLEFYSLKYVDYDEAMYATRVLQILEQPWPVEYNIQRWPRRGFLTREELLFYVSALFAKLFGLSYTAMKLLPFLTHLSIFILVFVFCYKFFSYEVALISSLFLVFQEHILQIYHYRLNCEYTITMFFIILLTHLFFKEILKDKNQKIIYFLIFGVISGIALDLFKPILVFLFTIILFLIYKKRRLIFSRNFFVLGLGFIISTIPRIIQFFEQKSFIYTHQGNPVSLLEISSWWLHLKTFPRKFLSLFNFFGNDSLYSYLISFILVIAFVLLYLFTLKEIWRYFKKSGAATQENLPMEILLFIDTYLALYLFTFIYVNDIITPVRYMYLVYPLIAVFFGISIMMIINRFKLKGAFNVMVVLLLCLGIFSNLPLIKTPDQFIYQPVLSQTGRHYRVKSKHLDQVFQFLHSKGIDHVFCERTLKWHVIFSSKGAIQASARFFTSLNYGVTLDQRFFDTLNIKNLCFIYYDTSKDSIKDSITTFLRNELKGKYKIKNIEHFNIAYYDEG